jgi:hypothetical protein
MAIHFFYRQRSGAHMSYLSSGSHSKNFKEASVGRNIYSTCISQILLCFKSTYFACNTKAELRGLNGNFDRSATS